MYAGVCLQSFARSARTIDSPVAFEAIVEQAQRLGDPTGVHVVVERHRAIIHRRTRIHVSVFTLGQRDIRELSTGGAIFVHVALPEHRDFVYRTQKTGRSRPLPMVVHTVGDFRPHPRFGIAAFSGAPSDTDVRNPGGNGHRDLPDRTATGAAAVVNLAEVGKLSETERPREIAVGRLLHGERSERIDFGRFDAGVVQGRLYDLAGEFEFRGFEAFREFRFGNADDGCLVLHHRYLKPSGSFVVENAIRHARTVPRRRAPRSLQRPGALHPHV
jgi:hypothetical protein